MMKIIEEVVEKKQCVGCGACANICKKAAIEMFLDGEGFYKPQINADKCVGCGLCDNVCPVLNASYENSSDPECYALMAEDSVRAVSSSGGAFSLLANWFFENGGYVSGVAYAGGCKKTRNVVIRTPKELPLIRGSKYIMSDTNDVFTQVKDLLRAKKYVLFSGLPCQVAGLKSFLQEDAASPYLLSVDLICHGIASVKAFECYMRDVHGDKKIAHLGFKDKEYGWHASLTIKFDSGELYNSPCEKDPYFISYLNGLNKNRACGNCKFARIPRQGDITIGDFWGISNYNPQYNDSKGTSVLLFNSERGKKYLEAVKAAAKLFEPVPLEQAIKGNSNLVSSPSVKISNSQFLRKLNTRRYPDLVNWGFADNRYDIGIVGIPLFPNFGGTLTYYSLYRSLKDMGYSVALFSRPRSTGRPPLAAEEIYHVNPFDQADMKLDFKDKRAMGDYANLNCENFVVGSDQLFNSDLYKKFGEIVTLDWVSDNHRKIAYAASFGHSFFWGPENERAKMAHYMQKFDAFSVREEDGITLAKQAFGADAEWVLDPVFLCDKQHYTALSLNSRSQNDTPHIFAYLLDPSEEKEAILSFIEKELDRPSELYSEMLYQPSDAAVSKAAAKFQHTLLQGKVEDRLYSLLHSDFIVADSFHGICFAIIFGKPFVAILNPLRGAARFYTLLGKLKLLDRMVTSVDELKQKPYLLAEPCDFSEANRILEGERKRSLAWLKSAIEPAAEVKKAFSSDDIADEKIQALQKPLLINELKTNAALSGRKYHTFRNIYDYLDALSKDSAQLTVLIAVKDTPGFSFNERMAAKLSALGLKTSLVDKHWRSYVAVIDGKKVVSEILSKKEERVAYVGTLGCGAVKLVSRSYNQGNIAFIGIDGTDYSENQRGLNIVVYDKTIGAVIDSVCFDTHDPLIPYYRFHKRFPSVHPWYAAYEASGETDRAAELPSGFPKEKADIFYCCRFAAERCGGRRIVLWGNDRDFRDILKEHFEIEADFVITERAALANGKTLFGMDAIKGKKAEYYIVVPARPYSVKDTELLKSCGYQYADDFIGRSICPIVLKNRNYRQEPYHDVFMNHITGDFADSSTIVLKGFNNHIDLGTNPSVAPDAALNITCDSNSELSAGSSVRYANKVEICQFGKFYKKCHVGNHVVFTSNRIGQYGDIGESGIIIGNGTTFNPQTILHCGGGKKLVIGEDVMFSNYIRVMCGDGHSLFDVRTGKNTNSVPDNLTKRQNRLIIGNHVWVGINSTLLAGSEIGDGSVIGANSLVKNVFPNNCVLGGNPAKLLKRDAAWSRANASQNIHHCGGRYVALTSPAKTPVSGQQVLVVGGTKFMGIQLVKELLARGNDVTIATRGITKDNFGSKVHRLKMDMHDAGSVRAALGGKYFDVVFDDLAYCPIYADQILASVRCGRYIQLSSVEAYAELSPNIKEEAFDPYTLPLELCGTDAGYVKGKRQAEAVVYQKYPNVSAVTVRIPYVTKTDRLYLYCRSIVKQTPMNIPDLTHGLTFIRDTEVGQFLPWIAAQDFSGPINLASEGMVTIQMILDYIEKKTKRKAVIDPDHGIETPFHAFDEKAFSMDMSKAKRLGYQPSNLNDWFWELMDEYIARALKEER